jgi:hypothetical protein
MRNSDAGPWSYCHARSRLIAAMVPLRTESNKTRRLRTKFNTTAVEREQGPVERFFFSWDV